MGTDFPCGFAVPGRPVVEEDNNDWQQYGEDSLALPQPEDPR